MEHKLQEQATQQSSQRLVCSIRHPGGLEWMRTEELHAACLSEGRGSRKVVAIYTRLPILGHTIEEDELCHDNLSFRAMYEAGQAAECYL